MEPHNNRRVRKGPVNCQPAYHKSGFYPLGHRYISVRLIGNQGPSPKSHSSSLATLQRRPADIKKSLRPFANTIPDGRPVEVEKYSALHEDTDIPLSIWYALLRSTVLSLSVRDDYKNFAPFLKAALVSTVHSANSLFIKEDVVLIRELAWMHTIYTYYT